jgi:glutamyl-tRNA synthetase
MLRFASSPTTDMHIGNLRIALLNYIVSKQRKENFIVRIEDIDKKTNVEGKDQETLDILALFGIEYSQVIYQSQNVRFHSAMALQLIHEKKAFSCFCSSSWLEKKQDEAKAAKKVYKYDDACRNLPAELVIDNTNPFTVRIVRPEGDLSSESDSVDSFVIMSQDKTPTYNFASAVDDMLNDIDIVIDEFHIDNVLKQEHIRASLSYDKKINYIDIPVMLSNNDMPSVKFLLEEGYLPEAISNYLVLIGNKTPKEIFTMAEAIEWFDISKISKTPTHFDMEMLKHINREHLRNLDARELSRYVGFADAEIGELARIYLDEVGTTKELKSKINPIFSERKIPEALAEKSAIMVQIIKNAPYFEEYDAFKNYILDKSKFTEKEFVQLLRLLLTNSQNGPDVANIYKYLKNYIGEIIK